MLALGRQHHAQALRVVAAAHAGDDLMAIRSVQPRRWADGLRLPQPIYRLRGPGPLPFPRRALSHLITSSPEGLALSRKAFSARSRSSSVARNRPRDRPAWMGSAQPGRPLLRKAETARRQLPPQRKPQRFARLATGATSSAVRSPVASRSLIMLQTARRSHPVSGTK